MDDDGAPAASGGGGGGWSTAGRCARAWASVASLRPASVGCSLAQCWRRLSIREKALPQWQTNGFWPVCFLQGRRRAQGWGASAKSARERKG